MYKGFKPMSVKEKKTTYGGWAAFAVIGALIPILLNSVVSTVASIKMMGSSKGSVKYQGLESHWENSKSNSNKVSPKSVETFVYAY